MSIYIDIAFEVLHFLFLLTALVAGWWVMAHYYQEKKAFDKSMEALQNEAYTLEARKQIETALDDFREELAPIKTHITQINTLLKQKQSDEKEN